jgi:branched-chain amino acid transport system ATP-binding protein
MTAEVNKESRRLADPSLRLSKVVAGYGDTEVLHGIDFDVGTGEVVVLVGRNGAGKTTTLRSIVGNIPPRSGQIRFDGENITDLGPEETVKHGIAIVPEERRIFPGLSVRENLELARLGGTENAAGRDLDEVFETFENLREHQYSPGSQLSGGEQQMLAIARALVSGADLLLLDEPTEGLAPLIVQRVEEVIRELGKAEQTVLLVEQNAQVALNVADYVYVIDNGDIVFEGTATEIRGDEEVLNRYLGVTI